MAARSSLMIVAAGAMLALTGIAAAAQERGEPKEVSEREIDLKLVPHGALAGATEVLASVSGARLVRFEDGRVVYELTGRSHAGESLEIYVSASGQVIGTEGKDDEN